MATKKIEAESKCSDKEKGIMFFGDMAIAELCTSCNGTGRIQHPEWTAWLNAQMGNKDSEPESMPTVPIGALCNKCNGQLMTVRNSGVELCNFIERIYGLKKISDSAAAPPPASGEVDPDKP